MKSKLSLVSTIFVIGFLLNLVWESLHHVLYTCENTAGCLLVASFVDGVLVVTIYLVGALWYRNMFWTYQMNKQKIALTLLVSLAIGYLIEFQGLYLNKWGYRETMPIIPFLNVGLSPILQMLTIPLVTFWLNKKCATKLKS